MTEKDMQGWIGRNCKFAAVPIPQSQSGNPLEQAVRDVANQVLQFMNKAKQTGHGTTDSDLFMRKLVTERAQQMQLDPQQQQEFMATVQDAIGAHGGANDPMPKSMGMGQKPQPAMPKPQAAPQMAPMAMASWVGKNCKFAQAGNVVDQITDSILNNRPKTPAGQTMPSTWDIKQAITKFMQSGLQLPAGMAMPQLVDAINKAIRGKLSPNNEWKGNDNPEFAAFREKQLNKQKSRTAPFDTQPVTPPPPAQKKNPFQF